MKNRTKFILGGIVGVMLVIIVAMLTFPILIVGVIGFAIYKNDMLVILILCSLFLTCCSPARRFHSDYRYGVYDRSPHHTSCDYTR